MFGPEYPIEDKGNRNRNIIAIAAVVLGIGIGVGSYIVPVPPRLAEFSVIFGRVRQAEDGQARATTGGDITAPPPAPPPPMNPTLTGSTSTVPDDLQAAAVLVKDTASGMVLFGKHEYEPRALASITKLMSALVLLERRIDWATTTRVVADDIEDTHVYAGDTHTLDDLWHAALVGSSNKSVMTLVDASGLARQQFIMRMNGKARELGMSDTTFVDPTGLDDDNISTASDIAILLKEALAHEEIKDAVLVKEWNLYSAERQRLHHMWNTDWLLLGWIPHRFKEVHGGKTGYIPSAGYNFAVQLGDGAGHDIDVVILGAPAHEDRFTSAKAIAEWAYQNYSWPEKSARANH